MYEGDIYHQSDDDFWNESQVGHDFGDAGTPTSFSPPRIQRGKFHVGYEGPKAISKSRFTFESSLKSPSAELKEGGVFQIKSSFLAITPKKHLRDTGTANCKETIKNIVLGLEYNLKPFKALSEKQKLLRTAILSHDGNAVLVVVLFLKNSLKKSIFQKEIMMQPDAVNMYLSYLHEAREIHELTDILLLARRPGDAAIFKYENANLIRDQKRKLNVLGNLLNTYCQPGIVERFISDSVLEQCMCIEDYKVLMDHKIVSQQCDENIFEHVIGRKEISDSCVVHALIFSILHFYNVPEIANISPTTIRARYKVPPQKFQWCALVTLAAVKSYPNLENLLLAKKWLGGIKIQSYIPYQTLLAILSKFEAPLEVMEKYINTIDYETDKLALARMYHCNRVVIEILKKKRSKSAFLEFRNTLSPDSDDYKIISNMLGAMDIKWRN